MALDGEGGGAQGGESFGSASDLTGITPVTPPAAAPAGDGAPGTEPAMGADPDWWGTLSLEADGENAANRDYVKAKNWKTMDDVVKSYREAERAVRDSGRVKIPGEGAAAEEVAAFNRAIGVPETVEGYKLPEVKDVDGNVVPLDQGLLGKLLPKALEVGVPAPAMDGLVAEFVKLQLDEAAQLDADMQNAGKAWMTKQGAQAAASEAAINTAARALGLASNELIAIRNAMANLHGAEAGVAKTLDMFTRLGNGMAEDSIITGGRGRFGVSGAEAQNELNAMKSRASTDKAFAQAVQTPGSSENARWNRLLGQATAYAQQQSAGG